MGGSSSRPKPTPAPQAAAPVSAESMQSDTSEVVQKKKKKQFKLEDTLSVFDSMQGDTGDLS